MGSLRVFGLTFALVVAVGFLALGCSGGTAPGSAVGSGGGGASGAAGNGTGGLVLSMGGMGGHSGGSAGAGGSVAGGAGGGTTDPNAPTITERDGCVPKPGPDIKDIPGTRIVRSAQGVNNIDAVVLFGGALYYAETQQGISRLSPPETQLGATLVSKFNEHVWSLLVAGSQLFTVETDTRELWRSSLASLPATPEVYDKDLGVDEQSMVADDTNLYFSTLNGGIYSLPLTSAPGTAPTQLVPTVRSSHMQLEAGKLYYMVDGEGVRRIPVSGGAPEDVGGGGVLHGMTVSDGVVYLAANEGISKQANAQSMQLATGTPISADSSHNEILYGLQANGDRIYYRQGGGTVAWVKKDGSDCRIVAELKHSGLGQQSLAITDTHYYVVVSESDLYEIPRQPGR